MTSEEVIDLYKQWQEMGVKVWIDGGWGVDALLGEESRVHKDLDIALQWKDVPQAKGFLETRGYKQTQEDSKWNFVMEDNHGNKVDFHAFVYDEQGNVVDGIMYPKESLTGTGSIDNTAVRCISPEWVVKFHSGYELQDKDFADISAICEKFNIPLPDEYRKFKKYNIINSGVNSGVNS